MVAFVTKMMAGAAAELLALEMLSPHRVLLRPKAELA